MSDPQGLVPMEASMSLSGMMFAAAIAVSAPAAPQIDSDTISARVSFADLDLSTSAGQARLQVRVASQIRRMCAAENLRDLRAVEAANACTASASRKAEAVVASAVATAARNAEVAAR